VAYLTANRSEGKLNLKKLQQSCITSLLTVLNNFIKNRLRTSSHIFFNIQSLHTSSAPVLITSL